MMKNKILKMWMWLLLTPLSFSCSDYLDVVPDNVATIEDAFQTRATSLNYLATLYSYMPNYGDPREANMALAGGDEVFPNPRYLAGPAEWRSTLFGLGGQTIAAPLGGYWGSPSVSNMFVALRDCNIFLENIDRAFDLSDEEKKRWVAEAKFLKAYYHFYLMRMYGPIPIIKENVAASAGVDAVRVFREPVDDVVNYIVELLDEAMPDLTATLLDPNRELGRATKTIVAAFKARVLVTAASPMFNGNTQYAGFVSNGKELFNQTVDDAKWERAAKAAEEAIDIATKAEYRLYEYTDAPSSFLTETVRKLSIRGSVTDPDNPELIWGYTNALVGGGIGGLAAEGTSLQGIIYPRMNPNSSLPNGNWGFYGPSLRMAELFYTKNGVPIDEDKDYDFDGRYKTGVSQDDDTVHVEKGETTANLHFGREARFYASIAFDRCYWESEKKEDDTKQFRVLRARNEEKAGIGSENENAIAGYLAKKLVHPSATSTGDGTGNSFSTVSYPFPIIRLADVYLLAAEAVNEARGPADAYKYIDEVRKRAGLKGVVDAWKDHAKEPGKPTTKEGFREIVRQERGIELAFEGHRFWDLRRWQTASKWLNEPVQGWNIAGTTAETYYNVVNTGISMSFADRDYLWPISENDMVRNSNLIQNPGW